MARSRDAWVASLFAGLLVGSCVLNPQPQPPADDSRNEGGRGNADGGGMGGPITEGGRGGGGGTGGSGGSGGTEDAGLPDGGGQDASAGTGGTGGTGGVDGSAGHSGSGMGGTSVGGASF